MKKVLLVFLIAVTTQLNAQKNIFLDQAFWRGNPDATIVKAEIDKGNNPAESNNSGFDGVVYAINAKAPVESIKLLLDQKGNDANKITHDGRTYIFWAASRGTVEVMEYLLSKGARTDIRDTRGMTALHFAAAAGQADTKVYDVLIKGGADVKEKNADGATALLLAVANDKDLLITNYFIAKGLSLKDKDNAGNTAFSYAARTGNIELMKKLVEKGVAYNDNAMVMATQGARGGTPNGVEVFQYLETLHLKPAAVNSNGENVLHNIARRPKQEELIKHFLAKGVDVNRKDNEGNTPFMNAAAANRDTATLALLLPVVSNINEVNKKGVSALAMAVRSNSAEVVQFLLNKGANIKVTDAEGNNLAYYLIQSSERQSPNNTRADEFEPKMKILMDRGYDLTMPQKDGSTLYHLAIAKNDLNLLKRIEKLHVDVNSKNKEGLTALHKAALIAKDDTILKYLLSIGANKELTTEFKETAFDMAKENEYLSKSNVSLDFLK